MMKRCNCSPRKSFPTFPRLYPHRGDAGGGLRQLAAADVAKLAGILNSGTARDIEAGRDAKLSSVEAIASVLGLHVTAVEPDG